MIKVNSHTTCKEIIYNYLKDNGYDGLCDDSMECGCGLDELMLCEIFDINCTPAYKSLDVDGHEVFSINKK